MAVNFYITGWLTASAGVGLIKAFKEYGEESFTVEGNKIGIPEELIEEIPRVLANILTENYELKESLSVKDALQKALSPFRNFHNNHVVINNSSIKKWAEEKEGKVKSKDELKKLLEEYLTHVIFENILKSKESEKACFFCNERKAYLKGREVSVFDATVFTPLSGSLETVNNFFYNGRSNLYLCKECELFFLFSSFGFTRTPRGTYIFAYVPDLMETYSINNMLHIEKEFSKEWFDRSVAEIVKNIEKEKADWLLSNIYFVELEPFGRDKSKIYTFSIPPRVARAMKRYLDEYPKNLNSLFGTFLEYIYSGRNLYELLLLILSGYLFSESYKKGGKLPPPIKFGTAQKFLPKYLLFFIKFQEVLDMRDNVEKQINWAYAEGLNLRKEIFRNAENEERAKKKIQGISYRLLDAVRRRDTDSFEQNVIRAYLEVEREIPYLFVEAMKSGAFNRIAYAFLIGLNGGNKGDGEPSE
ncbi:type I-B CRISPR-associated protein Cas8b1/Cst1 [Aquifex pyrophilus]